MQKSRNETSKQKKLRNLKSGSNNLFVIQSLKQMLAIDGSVDSWRVASYWACPSNTPYKINALATSPAPTANSYLCSKSCPSHTLMQLATSCPVCSNVMWINWSAPFSVIRPPILSLLGCVCVCVRAHCTYWQAPQMYPQKGMRCAQSSPFCTPVKRSMDCSYVHARESGSCPNITQGLCKTWVVFWVSSRGLGVNQLWQSGHKVERLRDAHPHWHHVQ